MYCSFVRNKVQAAFRSLSEGNSEPILSSLAPNFEHTFAGNHCLGGTRHHLSGMQRWFQRLFSLFPKLQFEIKNILVQGGPWHTLVAVEWIDCGTTQDGKPYTNNGAHILHLKWGKIISIHAYLDTGRAEAEFRRMAQQGISEAAALPIED